MRAVGILAGVVVGFALLASYVVSGARTDEINHGPDYQRLVAERLAPEVKVAVAGKDSATHQTRATTPAAPAAPAPAAVLSGEQVYSTTCIACHGAGVAGAPKFGDKGAWASRALRARGAPRRARARRAAARARRDSHRRASSPDRLRSRSNPRRGRRAPRCSSASAAHD